MRRYPSPRGPVSSSLASGVMTMPGLIALTRAPFLPQRTAMLAHADPPRDRLADLTRSDDRLPCSELDSSRGCHELSPPSEDWLLEMVYALAGPAE
jgi:hypothetical protein